MSYRSYDERQPLASSSRPRDALSHAADELQSLTQATRRLELYASRIGTAEDGQTLRSDIRACRTDIAKHIKNVASDLAQPVPPSDNARKDGLLQQLQQIVAQSKRATEQSLQRERASPMPQSYSDQGYNYQSGNAANPPQYGNSRMQAQDLEFESKLVEKTSQELDNEMIREQNRAMQSYKQELQSVAGLMADTARYIQEDTEQFRVAEQVSHRVSQNTKESDRIITSASQRQGSSRFKTCCMIAIIIIAVVIIALVIAGVLGMFGAF